MNLAEYACSAAPSCGTLTGGVALAAATNKRAGLIAGQTIHVTLSARDAFGNAVPAVSPSAFELVLQTADGVALDAPPMVAAADGTYGGTWTPRGGGGSYRLRVRHRETSLWVGGESAAVDFVQTAAPVAPERTRVTGGGLHGGVVGNPLTVRVALYDTLDNRVELPVHHNVTMTVLSGDFSAVVRELSVIPTIASGVKSTAVTEGVGSWTPETPGTYHLRVLTGSAEVDGSPFELRVTPAAAPVALSATLAAHGAAAVVAFDVDVRDAGLATGGRSTCAALLDATTVDMLGVDPQCTWTTARELVIRYGANATLTPADAVQVGGLYVSHYPPSRGVS
jgi:hypothetical protein